MADKVDKPKKQQKAKAKKDEPGVLGAMPAQRPQRIGARTPRAAAAPAPAATPRPKAPAKPRSTAVPQSAAAAGGETPAEPKRATPKPKPARPAAKQKVATAPAPLPTVPAPAVAPQTAAKPGSASKSKPAAKATPAAKPKAAARPKPAAKPKAAAKPRATTPRPKAAAPRTFEPTEAAEAAAGAADALTPPAPEPEPRPRPVSEGARGMGTTDEREPAPGDRGGTSGTELVSTAVQAAGQVAQIGLQIGGRLIKTVVRRLPRP